MAVSGPCNAPNENTSVRPTGPSIATVATPDFVLGAGQLSDNATVTGLVNPIAGQDEVVFRLYRGGDCADANLILTRTDASLDYNAASTQGAADSGSPFDPPGAGTYRWRAFYSGDDNNSAVAGPCNAPNENTVVAPAAPTIATVATPDFVLGAGQLSDNATVSGIVNPIAAQDSVTFRLYRGADCADANLILTRTDATLDYNFAMTQGAADSGAGFDPPGAGTYRWRAFYSGDDNNGAVSGPCNAPSENTVVAPAAPSIVTVATPDFVLGANQLSDNATVSRIVNPVSAQDEVVFRLYRGADCADANVILVRTDTSLTYNAGLTQGAADSGTPFDPPGAGTYRWRAFYSGDANNLAVSGPCNAPTRTPSVSPAGPSIATVATPDFVLGAGQLSDNATVSGIVNPIAAQDQVIFRLYRGGDCADANLILTRTDTSLDYNATFTQGAADSGAPFDPRRAGRAARWRAFYSGDDNNVALSGPCNASNENTVVAPASPSIATVSTPDFVLGAAQLSDNATVSGLVSPVAAQDEVVFRLYRGADCADANLILTRTDATLTYNATLTQGAADSGAPFDPPGAGTYRWRAFYSGDDNNLAVSGPCNAPQENTVVAPAAPSIATVATPDFVLGANQLSDNATVSGIVNPIAAQDSVTFRLYRGADCADADILLTRTDASLDYNATLTQGAADSGAPFDPPGAGTYRWRAFYSGDDNNLPVSGPCNAPNENTVVAPAAPAIATVATPNFVLGANQLSDNATVSGIVNPIAAQDSVTFRLYRGADCADANLILTRTDASLDYNVALTQGAADSGAPFDPPGAGTYRWRAFYSGDDNNVAVSGLCNAPNENTVVSPAGPTIATVATPNFVLGAGQLSDNATVSGIVNPVSAQDEVVFRLYRGADCDNANLILTRTDTSLDYNATLTQGAADSGVAFQPPDAGTYRWRAFYSGDDNNAAVSGPCNAPNENTVVAPAAPSIATVATANFVLGAGQLSDNATVSGLVNPVPGQDEVVFRLYRGSDCDTANLILTRTDTSLVYNAPSTTGSADSGTPFDPPGPGTYRWRAFYSGDDNNLAVSGPCNASNENTVVAPNAPAIATVATPGFVLGAGQLSDNATVSGLVSPIAAQDEVVFRLYRGADCADANIILTRTDTTLVYTGPPATTGAADSGAPFAPPGAGTYRWRAFYSGDDNNLPASGPCNAPNENTVVAGRTRRRSRRSRRRTSSSAPTSCRTTRRSAGS